MSILPLFNSVKSIILFPHFFHFHINLDVEGKKVSGTSQEPLLSTPTVPATLSPHAALNGPFLFRPPFWRGIVAWVLRSPAEEQPMKPDQSNPSEPFPRERIPPEILEWARQTLDEAEFLAHVREIEATGGVQLEDFIAELEARARSK